MMPEIRGGPTFADTAKGFLELDAWATERMANRDCFAKWLLARGQEFTGQPLPAPYERMVPKMCFMNAFRLAVNEGLTYVEGYSARADLPLQVHHAWNLDANGAVIDVTFAEPSAEDTYFGLVIPTDLLCEAVVATETYGVFFKQTSHELIERRLDATDRVSN